MIYTHGISTDQTRIIHKPRKADVSPLYLRHTLVDGRQVSEVNLQCESKGIKNSSLVVNSSLP